MSDNWGRWGDSDEAGAANLVTDEVTRRAATLVRSGHVVALAQPLGPATPSPAHRPAPSRFMNRDAGDYAHGARAPGGFRFAEDTVQFSTHSGTHVDALAHAWRDEQLYNGHPQASIRTTRGAQKCGADKLRPIVTRGVLVDVRGAGGEPLPPRQPVTPADLERGIAEQGVEIGAGDAVLVRTGWWESHGSAEDYFADEPGIDEHAAGWLAARDVSVVGADNYAVEQQGPEPGFPAHLTLLHGHGVPLVENLALEELGEALREAGRSTFLFCLAPLPLVGSTGSPATPLAVL